MPIDILTLVFFFYVITEGCSCCQDYRNHETAHKFMLAALGINNDNLQERAYKILGLDDDASWEDAKLATFKYLERDTTTKIQWGAIIVEDNEDNEDEDSEAS